MTFSVLTIIDSLIVIGGMELAANFDFLVTEVEDFFELKKNQCKKILLFGRSSLRIGDRAFASKNNFKFK